jgi:hypothetical protein
MSKTEVENYPASKLKTADELMFTDGDSSSDEEVKNGASNTDMKKDDDMAKGQDAEEEDLKKEVDDGKTSKYEKVKSGTGNSDMKRDDDMTKGQDDKEEDDKKEDGDEKSSKDDKVKSGTNNTDKE